MNYAAIVNKLQKLTRVKIVVRQDYYLYKGELFEKSMYHKFDNDDSLILIILSEIQTIAELMGMEEEIVFRYCLLHEIGHSLDKELKDTPSHLRFNRRLRKEHTFKMEVQAWRIADKFIGDINLQYKLMRVWALDTYAVDHPEWLDKYCPDYLV